MVNSCGKKKESDKSGTAMLSVIEKESTWSTQNMI